MHIELSPTHNDMINSLIESGRFASAEEVVEKALASLQAQESEYEAAVADVKASLEDEQAHATLPAQQPHQPLQQQPLQQQAAAKPAVRPPRKKPPRRAPDAQPAQPQATAPDPMAGVQIPVAQPAPAAGQPQAADNQQEQPRPPGSDALRSFLGKIAAEEKPPRRR